MNEHALGRKVEKYLDACAPGVCYEKRSPEAGRSGVADYVGCAWGRYFAIEIKHPQTKPKPRKDQRFFLDRVRAAGGATLEAWSLEDVQPFIERLK